MYVIMYINITILYIHTHIQTHPYHAFTAQKSIPAWYFPIGTFFLIMSSYISNLNLLGASRACRILLTSSAYIDLR